MLYISVTEPSELADCLDRIITKIEPNKKLPLQQNIHATLPKTSYIKRQQYVNISHLTNILKTPQNSWYFSRGASLPV